MRKIAALVLLQETPANRMLASVAMSGVNQNWRHCCRSLNGGSIAFDGTESMGAPPAPGGLMARFKKKEQSKKTASFESAARLLTGELQGKGEGGDAGKNFSSFLGGQFFLYRACHVRHRPTSTLFSKSGRRGMAWHSMDEIKADQGAPVEASCAEAPRRRCRCRRRCARAAAAAPPLLHRRRCFTANTAMHATSQPNPTRHNTT